MIMKIKYLKQSLLMGVIILASQSCFDLEEEAFNRVNAGIYYQNENSVKGSVAAIYESGFMSYIEYFWYLQEFSADQITWRVWNGGNWGWDEGEKYVLGAHTWAPNSTIIRKTWESSWTTIGLCNTLIEDLQKLDPAALKMSRETLDKYIAEVQTLRVWAYYNIYEIWGGALPLNTSASGEIPPSADPNFDEGCKKIYQFMIDELDACVDALPKNSVNRMNQAVNRIIKARLLLNANVFIKEDKFAECATLCQNILNGDFGTYAIADNYQDIYTIGNVTCPEVIMAFATEVGQMNGGWMRNMPFVAYNYQEYIGGAYSGVDAWNCVCLVPSYDNSGTIQSTGGSTDAKCFLESPYNDKLGAPYERLDNRDIRKQNFVYDTRTKTYKGLFLKGPVKASYGTGAALKADADRDGQDLVYVDQMGTFLGLGRPLEPVMSPRWGETNSGIRFIKYPMFPPSEGVDFRDIDEVEFRLAEVVFMLAECKLRAGDATEAQRLVNTVRKRYFSATDWGTAENTPGPGFTSFDLDWMLSQWGLEFLGEGRRRRTDLRRFDKFTQGQWWFHGRATEDGITLPAARDRKYEWFPLPETALMVNPGLVQNPNYN
jgi:hypothetical protein